MTHQFTNEVLLDEIVEHLRIHGGGFFDARDAAYMKLLGGIKMSMDTCKKCDAYVDTDDDVVR